MGKKGTLDSVNHKTTDIYDKWHNAKKDKRTRPGFLESNDIDFHINLKV